VICDDIRVENTGKQILVGVYSGAIVVPSFPGGMETSLYLNGWSDQLGSMPFAVRITGDDGSIFFETSDLPPVQVVETGPFVISVSGIPIALNKEVTLMFEVKLGEADWREVLRRSVRLRQQKPVLSRG
jgi:hypothetical protein